MNEVVWHNRDISILKTPAGRYIFMMRIVDEETLSVNARVLLTKPELRGMIENLNATLDGD